MTLEAANAEERTHKGCPCNKYETMWRYTSIGETLSMLLIGQALGAPFRQPSVFLQCDRSHVPLDRLVLFVVVDESYAKNENHL